MPITNKKSVSKKQPEETNNSEMVKIMNRNKWIKESAYYIAESRGFIPGGEQKDWNIAEEQYNDYFPPTPA